MLGKNYVGLYSKQKRATVVCLNGKCVFLMHSFKFHKYVRGLNFMLENNEMDPNTFLNTLLL